MSIIASIPVSVVPEVFRSQSFIDPNLE